MFSDKPPEPAGQPKIIRIWRYYTYIMVYRSTR